MVKFAKSEEPRFDPIEKHTVHSIANPALQTPAPALSDATPDPNANAGAGARRAKSERPKKSAARKSPLERLINKRPEKAERLSRVVKGLFTPTEETELRELVSRLGR